MANNQNLKRLSPKEARENGRKGGLASVKARRERKTMKELLLLALEAENESGETNAESIVASMIRAAREGDVRAFVEIRDTIGEKPESKTEIKGVGEPLIISWGAPQKKEQADQGGEA